MSENEGPEDGHTFRIVFDSRESYTVVGDEHHTDAPDFHGIPHVVEVRAWNLRDALRKAADLPFDVLMGTPYTAAVEALADHPHTDPGDGRQQCETCGKWVWLVTHSCKGVRVAPAAGQGDEREALARIFYGGSDEIWAKFRDKREAEHAWIKADAVLAAGFHRMPGTDAKAVLAELKPYATGPQSGQPIYVVYEHQLRAALAAAAETKGSEDRG